MAGWNCPNRETIEWDGTISAKEKLTSPTATIYRGSVSSYALTLNGEDTGSFLKWVDFQDGNMHMGAIQELFGFFGITGATNIFFGVEDASSYILIVQGLGISMVGSIGFYGVTPSAQMTASQVNGEGVGSGVLVGDRDEFTGGGGAGFTINDIVYRLKELGIFGA